MVFVNNYMRRAFLGSPFGGVKGSGFGRENAAGDAGLSFGALEEASRLPSGRGVQTGLAAAGLTAASPGSASRQETGPHRACGRLARQSEVARAPRRRKPGLFADSAPQAALDGNLDPLTDSPSS